MKFFIDTADIAEIKELAATGLLDGVTTNPTLVAKIGRDFKQTVRIGLPELHRRRAEWRGGGHVHERVTAGRVKRLRSPILLNGQAQLRLRD